MRALTEPGIVRLAPTLFVCTVTFSSAFPYCSMNGGVHGVPLKYVEKFARRKRTRRLPWRSVFQPQCLGRPLLVRSMNLVPRVCVARRRASGLAEPHEDLAGCRVDLDRRASGADGGADGAVKLALAKTGRGLTFCHRKTPSTQRIWLALFAFWRKYLRLLANSTICR